MGQGITVKSFDADKVTEMVSLVGGGKLRLVKRMEVKDEDIGM